MWDWLTADLAIDVMVTVFWLWIVCWLAGGVLWLLCCEDGWRQLRTWWRVWQQRNREERARRIRAEWNPRPTALRGEFGAPIRHKEQ